jgi:hypothetical protein
MVGAIIGREGNTIRMLTQKTKARYNGCGEQLFNQKIQYISVVIRVDVHRKENPGALEKVTVICGTVIVLALGVYFVD